MAFIERMSVTPEIARRWLDKNNNPLQRPINKSHLAKLIAGHVAGKFAYTGEPIILAEDEEILDGQHRLHMVVQTGIPAVMDVRIGVPKSSMPFIGQSDPRDAADVLAAFGHSYANGVAAVAKSVLWYEAGCPTAMGHFKAKLLNSDVLAVVQERPEIEAAVQKTRQQSRACGLATASAATAMYFTDRINYKKSAEFFDGLSTGAHLAEESPVLTLRNRLLRKERLRQREELALYVKAWNKFARGETAALIRFNQGEQFPQFEGLDHG